MRVSGGETGTTSHLLLFKLVQIESMLLRHVRIIEALMPTSTDVLRPAERIVV